MLYRGQEVYRCATLTIYRDNDVESYIHEDDVRISSETTPRARTAEGTAIHGLMLNDFGASSWKVDCHEESIKELDLHFLNPQSRGNGESARARASSLVKSPSRGDPRDAMRCVIA